MRIVTLLLCLSALASAGTITQVSSDGVLNPDGWVTWGAVGDEGSNPVSPYLRTSTGGLSVTATHSGDFLLLVQGSSYFGNFNAGDIVLGSNFSDGPVTITFGAPIQGLGLFIQRDQLGSFAATMTAYGAGNVNFGGVSVNGTTAFSEPGDGTAPYLGLKSSLQDIVAVTLVVSHTGEDAGDYLNFTDLSILTKDAGSGGDVPEPSSAALVLGAGAALALWKSRRSS